jgi:tetratricopeptide (TPR) repeat protein
MANINELFTSLNGWRKNIPLTFIIILTVILFLDALNFNFVIWDDPEYVVNNHLIKTHSFEGLQKIFSTPIIGMYNPLPFLIYSLIHRFFGLDPQVFHFFNLLFHIIATLLAYRFIFTLTKRHETAAIVALLFAIHPMHVSVVTWISQTKTSLCVIFYFSALINYINYVQNNYRVKYLVYVALFFVLAAISQPFAVTIAPMLFLLDYYLSRNITRKIFIEKIPFFTFALFFGILTLLTHAEDSIFEVNYNYSFINNLLIANYSVVFYINKLLFPLKLSAIYPYPENATFLPLKYYLSTMVIPFILLLIYKSGKFKKEIIFGLLFFIIAISVLVRIVPSGFFRAANRYTYLSYTGLFFVIAQYITYILDNKFSYARKIRTPVVAFLFMLVVFYSYRTTVRVDTWQNTIVLFDDVIKKNPRVPVAYNNRGFAKMLSGDTGGALADYEEALAIDPTFVDAYLNRGGLHLSVGNVDNALVDYSKAIEIKPDCGPAFFNRGLIKISQEDIAGAMEDLIKADSLGIKQAQEKIQYLSSISVN